jgi:hypothetical protein
MSIASILTISGIGTTLQQGGGSFDDPYIYIILLALGGFLFILQFKIMFFPTWKGKIIEFEDLSPESCNSCKSAKKGRTSIEIKVKTEDGEIIDAEVSCCSICMNKLSIGSQVGVTKMGSRRIASSMINLTRGSAG